VEKRPRNFYGANVATLGVFQTESVLGSRRRDDNEEGTFTRMSSLQTGTWHADVRESAAMTDDNTTMPTTVILMTLSAKSSALHSGTHLLSTLILLLAPPIPTLTSLALAFSPPLSPRPSPPVCSFFCCCWGALLRSRSFHYHNHFFPLLVAIL